MVIPELGSTGGPPREGNEGTPPPEHLESGWKNLI